MSGRMSGSPVAPATSRAMPVIDRRSGRLDSISRSSTTSSSPSVDLRSAPTVRSSGRSRMPVSCSWETASSRGEHNIPLEISSRSGLASSGRSSTGTRAPGRAHGTRSPGFMFRTPTTTCVGPSPPSTIAMHSFSAFGWSRTSSTRATTTPASPSHGRSIVSRWTPFSARRSLSSSGDRSVGHRSRNHPRGTRISQRPRTARGTGHPTPRGVGCRGSGNGSSPDGHSPLRTRTPCIAPDRCRSSRARPGAPSRSP